MMYVSELSCDCQWCCFDCEVVAMLQTSREAVVHLKLGFHKSNATQHVASCCVALLRIASGAKIFSVAWRCSRVHVVVHEIFLAHFCTFRVHIQTGKNESAFSQSKFVELIERSP